MPSLDEKLVYLHCSSIFIGKSAEIRQLKAVKRRLSDCRTSIQALTQNFSVLDIATVAKRLLEEGIFQSVPQAKRRFPELFQQPEAKEAKSKASKANVARLEAEEAHEAVSTSEEETGSGYDGTPAYLRRLPSKDSGCGARQVSSTIHERDGSVAHSSQRRKRKPT
jgi:primosomal protein N'